MDCEEQMLKPEFAILVEQGSRECVGEWFRTNVPHDLCGDVGRKEQAIREVREACSTYKMPCVWEAYLPADDSEDVFVLRVSRLQKSTGTVVRVTDSGKED